MPFYFEEKITMRKRMIIPIISAAAIMLTSLPTVTVFAEDTKPKLIALAFDDGPNTTTTNEVLDVLEANNAKASFFVIGDNINDESAKSIKRAYDMGMEIDNHSKTHTSMTGMTAEEMLAEINYVDEKVEAITGEKTKFFRPPYISVNQAMYDTIDLPFIYGADTQDYMEEVDAEERANRIIRFAKDGTIYLMHDLAGNSQTVEALKNALPVLAEQGYEFVTISELFERQGETPRKNILYSSVAKYPTKNYALYKDLSEGTESKIMLDMLTLKALGDTFAVEVDYVSSSGNPPVLAIQRWTTTPSLWHAIQPCYSNGEKAVFTAADVLAAFEKLDVDYDSIDGLSVSAYGGTIELSNAKLLVKPDGETPAKDEVRGDVNGDGEFNIADAVTLQKWLISDTKTKLTNWQAGDLCKDSNLDVFDLCVMKRELLVGEN